MAADNDNESLRAMRARDRDDMPGVRVAYIRCVVCDETIAAGRGQLRRCSCGTVELEHPGWGGLGPRLRWFTNRG